MMALHDNARGYVVSHVISSSYEARGLQWASERGIPTSTVARSDFSGLSEFKAAVLEAVMQTKPDFVALAGFMVVLQPEFVDAFHGRLVNIHPSLLPKFPGLDTHRRALDAGETHHGASVHFVTAGVDAGAVIAQGRIGVESGDSPKTLAARTLAVEHRLYPWVLRHLARGEISLTNEIVSYSDQVRNEAVANRFTLADY